MPSFRKPSLSTSPRRCSIRIHIFVWIAMRISPERLSYRSDTGGRVRSALFNDFTVLREFTNWCPSDDPETQDPASSGKSLPSRQSKASSPSVPRRSSFFCAKTKKKAKSFIHTSCPARYSPLAACFIWAVPSFKQHRSGESVLPARDRSEHRFAQCRNAESHQLGRETRRSLSQSDEAKGKDSKSPLEDRAKKGELRLRQ